MSAMLAVQERWLILWLGLSVSTCLVLLVSGCRYLRVVQWEAAALGRLEGIRDEMTLPQGVSPSDDAEAIGNMVAMVERESAEAHARLATLAAEQDAQWQRRADIEREIRETDAQLRDRLRGLPRRSSLERALESEGFAREFERDPVGTMIARCGEQAQKNGKACIPILHLKRGPSLGVVSRVPGKPQVGVDFVIPPSMLRDRRSCERAMSQLMDRVIAAAGTPEMRTNVMFPPGHRPHWLTADYCEFVRSNLED